MRVPKTTAGLATKYEINADMGEGFGRWKMGPDEELMPLLDAANIACGFHAGDPSIMLKTVRLCKQHNVRAGAHPGLPDLLGFGRRRFDIAPADIYSLVLYQVGALQAMLTAEGMPLSHIKPHGELFFVMQRDTAILRAVLDACAHFPGVPVYGSAGAAEEAALCDEMGLAFQGELYVDIDYSAEGTLVPPAKSQVATPELCGQRAHNAMSQDKGLNQDGKTFTFGFGDKPFSICMHSDMPTVLDNTLAVRKAVDEMNKKRGWTA